MLPCVPFMALTFGQVADEAWGSAIGKVSLAAYFIAIIYFFYSFYPVLTGITKPYSFYDRLFGFSLYSLIVFTVFINGQLFLSQAINLLKNINKKP